MDLVLDFPLVRSRLKNCPLCDDSKSPESLVCWTCYRKHDLRNGTPVEVKKALLEAEEKCFAQRL